MRLNFAGGEPLLHTDRILLIAKQARKLGFKLSIITNGSLLNTNLLSQLAPQLTWLGISIDSLTPATNIAIGRVNSFKKVIDIQELPYQLDHARQVNPSLRIKINTVVNSLNHDETLEKALCELSPNKWKVLRMLPVVNKNLAITDKQFMDFISRHQSFEKILCAEDNKDMCESYLMIDPNGRFFQNSSICPEAGYVYSKPILDVGIEAVFNEINFMHKRFHARYSHSTLEDTYEVFL
ncbi:viperin family antiviral radical SAM protein [Halodesulfovibrio aestuarii]|uniref:S-adenosylmethionine-dependent nucleotide dehydratase n=1 Tax=Halodesulfovibrio aestuarii TaxID=126333 RepID=A0ABV4JWL0_9BACT